MTSILKSIFLPLLLLLAILLFIWSIIQFEQGIQSAGFVALTFQAAIIPGYFGLLYTGWFAGMHKNLVIISIISVLLAVVASFQFISTGLWLEAIASFILALGWLGYVQWYSTLPSSGFRLKRGMPFPTDISLSKSSGEKFTLNELPDKYKVIVFYRGNWCPICMAQIKELARAYQQLALLDAEVLMVSPQDARHTEKLSQRFDIPLQFLVDENNKLAKHLGIAHRFGIPLGIQLFRYKSTTVLPTVVILNRSNKVIYHFVADNYRLRAGPEQYIEIIRKYEDENRE